MSEPRFNLQQLREAASTADGLTAAEVLALVDAVEAAHATRFVPKDAFFAGQVEGVTMTPAEFNERMKPLHDALARFDFEEPA